MKKHLATLAAFALLGTAPLLSAHAASATAPKPATCPAPVPEAARCYTGEDGEGAFYWIAIPKDWNRGVLVMHAHGGPETGPPKLERSEEDLKRWAITVKAGYAWAGSTYRRGGYGVTMAAEDTERLRRIFVRHFGQPKRTLLHGQSYGGGVAAKAAELYAPVGDAKSPYDGLLLTSGVIGGGNSNYDFRLDLRVVYQYVCRNHPRPDEPQYPLWMGLPADSKLTRAELAARVRECTGVGMPPAQRTPEQAARLQTILSVVKIQERSLVGHLNWATWLFQDLVQKRLGGRNPFGNIGVVYSGSADDAALNAGVLRYAADPQAKGALAADSQPTGRTSLPTVGLHAIDDPTAFVELENAYRRIRDAAGTGGNLVQSFSAEREHSYLSDSEYPALFGALMDWIEKGEKPTPQSLAQRCASLAPRYDTDGKNGCHIRPEWQAPALESRVPARAP
ncbi:alpha/beta hydrolase family protein [Variovorax boronicumulans]|uniref:alpha/beta hydrolase family protein n=1 Tax=Variovorax boronicumulans TaxID=436515 RepID=UPI00339AC6FF